ncbi:MAG: DUF3990 domain-containing protein [Bacteroidales bacterium]|nr:DUF3990 domain-containing protein [Bacteroidales bacterium]
MIELYHGSDKIVRTPEYGKGNPLNDYGLGFYCTREIELAKEWACSETNDGFANHYMLDEAGLSCLYLNGKGYHILNWLAILLENRRFDLSSPISVRAKKYILDNFLPDYKDSDLIVGYRADDSYFSFSRAFLSNTITLEQLRRAMHLGKLGEQTVLRSPSAFEAISFINPIPADASVYHAKRSARDREARESYQKMLTEAPSESEVFVSTILNEKWTNEDPRL